MSSGRRESVLIFCISPLKELYLGPISHYDPDRIYVLVDRHDGRVFDFQRKQYESLKGDFECDDIRDVTVDTKSYDDVLGTIIDIKRQLDAEFGDDLDLFINISSGSNEYAAAAMFASMLPRPSIAFRVDVSDNGMSVGTVSEIVSKISSSCEFSDPERFVTRPLQNLDEEMTAFLHVMKRLLAETRSPRHADIIEMLKQQHSWSYDPKRKRSYERTPLESREEMYLKRHYLEPAVANGWLEKPYKNVFRLTELGLKQLAIFMEPEPCFDRCMREINCCEFATDEDNLLEELDSDDRDVCRSLGPSSEENTVSIEHNGKRYSFHIGMD